MGTSFGNTLKKADWTKKFAPNSIAAILAEHVWEHLTYEEGIEAAKICYEFLQLDGYIRCAVPDAFFPDEDYQAGVQVGGSGPLDHPAASHKIVHNYKTMTSMFEEAGFEVKLLEYCDENGRFIITTGMKKKVLFIGRNASIIAIKMENLVLSH